MEQDKKKKKKADPVTMHTFSHFMQSHMRACVFSCNRPHIPAFGRVTGPFTHYYNNNNKEDF